MGFNLDDLMGQYKDYARSYLFYCKVLAAPVGALVSMEHHYLVNSTQLPQQNIDQADVNWQGNIYKLATTNTFDDFTVTFRSDAAHDLRRNFLSWMSQIHNPVDNVHGDPGQGGYFGTVSLDQLDKEGSPIMTYTLIGAWPKIVGELSLAYDSKEVATFDVTFAYQYHTVDDVFGGENTPTGVN
jgi:hypothetical protein